MGKGYTKGTTLVLLSQRSSFSMIRGQVLLLNGPGGPCRGKEHTARLTSSTKNYRSMQSVKVR